MAQSQRIKKLLKQIVNGDNHEPFNVYLAQVLTDSECSGYEMDGGKFILDSSGNKIPHFPNYNNFVGRNTCFDPVNLTVAVKLVTDQSNNSGYTGVQYGIVPNQTIIPNVTLMCDVDDGPFTIPAQGSSVLIGISGSLLAPFIMQYSSVYGYLNSARSFDNSNSLLAGESSETGTLTLCTANDSNGNPISGSEIRQEKDQISLYVTDELSVSFEGAGILPNITGANTTRFFQSQTQLGLGAGDATNPNTQYTQDKDKILLSKKDGIQLTFGNRFNVTNGETADLNGIISGLNSNLNNLNIALGGLIELLTASFAAGSFPSAASTYAAGVGSLVSDISTISSNISTISTEISEILGAP